MRSHLRNVTVLAAAIGLLALFLRHVDLWRVGTEIARARPEWLALSIATMFGNLAIRSLRWQYLLAPLGGTSFQRAFRATAVGFAATALLPARAGEVIRPYFLARCAPSDARMSAITMPGAFATVIIERLLDIITVLILLAAYVFVFGRERAVTHPVQFAWLIGVGATAAIGSAAALVILFVLAGDPGRLRSIVERLVRVLPPAMGGALARVAENFALGLAAIRRPRRVVVALLWALPLWLCIALGIWSAGRAFSLDVPFTGVFLVIALLTLGVAVPTPGAVGGFHAAYRYGVTVFFGAPEDAAVGAAIVLHLLSVGPSVLLGLLFAAQEGLDVSGMRRLVADAGQGQTA